MRSILRPFLKTLGYLMAVQLLTLLVLSAFRLTEYLVLYAPPADGGSVAPVWPAFLCGVWFDNVIVCYVQLLPLAVLLVLAMLGVCRRTVFRVAGGWSIFFSLWAFMASAGNIPYYAFFSKNINSSIFEWFGYAGTTAGMVTGERSFWGYILLYFVLLGLYGWAVIRLGDRVAASLRRPLAEADAAVMAPSAEAGRNGNRKAVAGYLLCSLLTLGLVGLTLFGIRGRVGYNPIKISEAYYCNDPFLNQLGINPAFNLLTSALDDMRKENKPLQLMPSREAVSAVRGELGITAPEQKGQSPLRRHMTAPADTLDNVAQQLGGRRPNVVIILMESMSADLTGCLGGKAGLTPTLDSLYHHSLAFSHFYSAGIHTNHGLTATLYSFPALMFRNLMKGTVTPRREGIPTVLKSKGYHNLFFMTHEAQYDNMNAFFRTNGYDEIYSQEDYPRSARVNAFGVPDKFLFSYALPVLRQRAASGKPFFATLLTISNHPPYVVPKAFRKKGRKDEESIVNYADAALGDFLRAAQREPWYKETIFVVLADHGKLVGRPSEDLPRSFNHIPCFIFGPGVRPRVYDGLGTQVDIMPTLLGLLRMDYPYEGFGQDLLRRPRQTVYYSADDVLAARGRDRLFLYYPATARTLTYAVSADGRERVVPNGPAFNPLRRYAFSMAQTATLLLKGK